MESRDELQILNYKDLIAHEREILRRIREKPNGGRLLLIDPLRLLRDIGVRLDRRAITEWQEAAGGELFTTGGYETAYDAVAVSDPSTTHVTVNVASLFPRRNV
jgi:hypothetical protein